MACAREIKADVAGGMTRAVCEWFGKACAQVSDDAREGLMHAVIRMVAFRCFLGGRGLLGAFDGEFPTLQFGVARSETYADVLYAGKNGILPFWDVLKSRRVCEWHAHGHAILESVYEKLLGAFFEKRRELGIYYTPIAVVGAMCERAIFLYLSQKHPEVDHRMLRALIFHAGKRKMYAFCPEDADRLTQSLWAMKVLDPSCGCGAFVFGMAQVAGRVICRLMGKRCGGEAYRRAVCRFFSECVYGMDIDQSAIQIVRYRAKLQEKVSACGRLSLAGAMKMWLETPDDGHFYACNTLLSENIFKGVRFDVVIGNPPYGVRMTREDKDAYRCRFCNLGGRFDIYLAFLEWGLARTDAVMCYITPDKWLSNHHAQKFRECSAMAHLASLVRCGSGIFGDARVDGVISVWEKARPAALDIYDWGKRGIKRVGRFEKAQLRAPVVLDHFWTASEPLVGVVERQAGRLGDCGDCCYAFASVQSAYRLASCIEEGADDGAAWRILNCGTIGKYVPRWGEKHMRYLSRRYAKPVVDRANFLRLFGDCCEKKMARPKIILKGLNLLDGCLDLDGRYISTVATLHVYAQDLRYLKILCAILNSSLAAKYFKLRYASSSWNGAVRFTPGMISGFGIPKIDVGEWQRVIDGVDRLMVCADGAERGRIETFIDRFVYRRYREGVKK